MQSATPAAHPASRGDAVWLVEDITDWRKRVMEDIGLYEVSPVMLAEECNFIFVVRQMLKISV